MVCSHREFLPNITPLSEIDAPHIIDAALSRQCNALHNLPLALGNTIQDATNPIRFCIARGNVRGDGRRGVVGRDDKTCSEARSAVVDCGDFRGGGTAPCGPCIPFVYCARDEFGAQFVAGEVGEETGRGGGIAFDEVARVVGAWVGVGEGGAPDRGAVGGVDEDVEEDATLFTVSAGECGAGGARGEGREGIGGRTCGVRKAE